MHQGSSSTNAERKIERRAIKARRQSHGGDNIGALLAFDSLLPCALRSLNHERLLRFLAMYSEALRRRRDPADFETLCLIAEELEKLRGKIEPEHPTWPNGCRRHLEMVVTAFLDLAEKSGTDSGIGQACLRRIWSYCSTLDMANSEIDGPWPDKSQRIHVNLSPISSRAGKLILSESKGRVHALCLPN